MKLALAVSSERVVADGALTAIDERKSVSKEVHRDLVDAAIVRGARALLVSQLVSLGEPRAIRRRALKVLGQQLATTPLSTPTPSAHLRSISMMYCAARSSAEAQ